MQSEQDAARYLELGAPRHAVKTIGNLKYDAEPSRGEPPRIITELIAQARIRRDVDRRQHHARRGSRRCRRR